MPLRSMTGFGRRDGSGEGHRWSWETRSVNGKGLDLRLRLPAGFEHLEFPARERATKAVARGNLQLTLNVQLEGGTSRIRINTDVLAEMMAAMKAIGQRIDAQPPTLDGILALRGVVDTADAVLDEATRERLAKLLLADLDLALVELVAARVREGAAIAAVLALRLDEIDRLTTAAEASPARKPEAIRARLAADVAALLDAGPSLDQTRLHQEAVLLATKADIREELDRLNAHVIAARAILAEDGAVGRRLDFLAQEFGREANTLCSKAGDVSVSRIGLDLKATVEQFREQIQNVE